MFGKNSLLTAEYGRYDLQQAEENRRMGHARAALVAFAVTLVAALAVLAVL